MTKDPWRDRVTLTILGCIQTHKSIRDGPQGDSLKMEVSLRESGGFVAVVLTSAAIMADGLPEHGFS